MDKNLENWITETARGLEQAESNTAVGQRNSKQPMSTWSRKRRLVPARSVCALTSSFVAPRKVQSPLLMQGESCRRQKLPFSASTKSGSAAKLPVVLPATASG